MSSLDESSDVRWRLAVRLGLASAVLVVLVACWNGDDTDTGTRNCPPTGFCREHDWGDVECEGGIPTTCSWDQNNPHACTAESELYIVCNCPGVTCQMQDNVMVVTQE